jgi:ribosomal RNA-processing protein 8
MFAVKGWSISAPLKTQTGPVVVPTLSTGNGAKLSEGVPKKRKRGHPESDKVNHEPVSEKRQKRVEDIKEGKGTRKGEQSVERKVERKTDRKAESKTEKKTEKTLQRRENEDQPKVEKKPAKDQADVKREKKKPVSEVQASTDKSKDKKVLKEEKTRRKTENRSGLQDATTTSNVKSQIASVLTSPSAATKLTPMQASMQAKLASARFRHLNETLYTSASEKALDLFKKNPEMFDEYHSGFRQQVDVWPENPVDAYIADIRRRGAIKSGDKDSSKSVKGLVRTHGTCTIADLGCGDAKLASELQKSQMALQVKILSYDLHNPSPLVQRADIANLPLEDGSVNIAIFCLALMGTNWPDFIDEAYRILHWKGELWIAEIKSRFGRVEKKSGLGKVVEHSVGNKKKKPRSKMSEAEKKREDNVRHDEDTTLAVEVDGVVNDRGSDETDVTTFIKVLASRGFVLDGEEGEAVERNNKMFVKMRFLKAVHPTKGKNVTKGKEGATWKPKGKKFMDAQGSEIDEGKVLKPCVYKLR